MSFPDSKLNLRKENQTPMCIHNKGIYTTRKATLLFATNHSITHHASHMSVALTLTPQNHFILLTGGLFRVIVTIKTSTETAHKDVLILMGDLGIDIN